MIEGFLSGVVLGLTMAIMLGPALFSLLQTSIHKGFRTGMFLAVGIFISDVVLVALSYLGVSSIINEPGNEVVFGIVGGAVMIIFGFFTFRKKKPLKNDTEEDEPAIPIKRSPLKYMAKGFILNLANPFLLIFWMGWMAYVGNMYGSRSLETLFFFSGTLITVFSTDLLKCFIAGRLKKYLRPRIITIVNYILGVVLILLGIIMIIRVTLKDPKGDKFERIENKITTPVKKINS
jgi:threonine/homoserine/homoserine lactone efflux protein